VRISIENPKATENHSMKQKRLRRPPRSKLNLTIHPEIKDFALEISNKRRRSLAQLFEDLVEAEWNRVNGIQPSYPTPSYTPLQQLYQPKPGYYQAPSSP
jgi:hypothetical protein